jgi:hypothetical protein
MKAVCGADEKWLSVRPNAFRGILLTKNGDAKNARAFGALIDGRQRFERWEPAPVPAVNRVRGAGWGPHTVEASQGESGRRRRGAPRHLIRN